jgi:endonuclease I
VTDHAHPAARTRVTAIPVVLVILAGMAGALRADPPPDYYQSAAGLTGPPLRAELHRIVKSRHLPMVYGATRAALEVCDQDPNNPNHVILLYSRRSEPRSNFVRSPPQNATEWNREHLWPDSRGILGEGPDYSDLFNLRPADVTVNSDRANLAFEETEPTAGMVVPGSPEAPQSSRDSNSFEPPPSVKGDIARAMFYMALRYDGDAPQESDLTLTDNMSLVTGNQPVMGRLTTLLLWHLDDPVSPEEVLRNDRVEQHQGNRNPFIDCPKWVTAVFGDPLLVTGEVIVGGNVRLTWWAGLENPVPESGVSLNSAAWTVVPGSPSLSGDFASLTIPADGARRFYRVRYRGIVSP